MTTLSTAPPDTAILRKTRPQASASKMSPARYAAAGFPSATHTALRSAAEPSSVIAVAAKNYLVQQGLVQYLKSSRFQAVAVMASPSELVSSIAAIQPQVVIIEISSQSMEGFETIAAIRRINPAIKILALADYTMPSLVKMVYRSGAHGYLLSMPTQISMLTALDAIGSGENVLDKQLAYIRPTLSNVLTAGCITI